MASECSAFAEIANKGIESNYMGIYMGLAQCYNALGQNQKALAVLEEGLKKLPRIAWAFNDFIAAIYISQC